MLTTINNSFLNYLEKNLEAIYFKGYVFSEDVDVAFNKLCSLLIKKYYDYPQYAAINFYSKILSPERDKNAITKAASHYQKKDSNGYNKHARYLLGRRDQEKYIYSNNDAVFTEVGKPGRKKPPKRKRKRFAYKPT